MGIYIKSRMLGDGSIHCNECGAVTPKMVVDLGRSIHIEWVCPECGTIHVAECYFRNRIFIVGRKEENDGS